MAYGMGSSEQPFGMPKRKTIFGKTVDPMAYSTPTVGPMQHSPEQRQAQQPMPEQKKPGFLGKGGTGRAILGTVGDYLMQREGMDPVYAPTMMMQQQQEAAARQAQLQRAQEMADWRAKKEYEWENAPAPNNDTVRDFEWYSSLTPEQRATYHEMKPEIMMGADGRPYPVRKTPAPPEVLPSDFDFGGGSAGNGTGGFPG